jgi:hypothetical protein
MTEAKKKIYYEGKEKKRMTLTCCMHESHSLDAIRLILQGAVNGYTVPGIHVKGQLLA